LGLNGKEQEGAQGVAREGDLENYKNPQEQQVRQGYANVQGS
jgi:hypothetical protein